MLPLLLLTVRVADTTRATENYYRFIHIFYSCFLRQHSSSSTSSARADSVPDVVISIECWSGLLLTVRVDTVDH